MPTPREDVMAEELTEAAEKCSEDADGAGAFPFVLFKTLDLLRNRRFPAAVPVLADQGIHLCFEPAERFDYLELKFMIRQRTSPGFAV